MRFETDPMTVLRLDAVNQINDYFNSLAAGNMQQDHEHTLKRTAAQQVDSGLPASPEFTAAAAIEGLTPQTLATVILAKPDDVMVRANNRRTVILQAKRAATPDELQTIITAAGVNSGLVRR